jgi:hypothetical protein
MRFLVDECTGPAVAHWLRLLEKYEKSLPGNFSVVTETTVRITENIDASKHQQKQP